MFCGLAVIITSLLNLIQPLALREFFNAITDGTTVSYALAALVLAFIASAIFGSVSSYLAAKLSADTELFLRDNIFSEFFSDVKDSRDSNPANGVSLIMNDAALIATGITTVATVGVGSVFTFLGSLGATLYFFPAAVFSAALFSLISFFLTFYIGGRLRTIRIRVQNEKARTMSVTSDLLRASRQINHYKTSPFFRAMARSTFLKLFDVNLELRRKQAVLTPFLEISTKASFLVGVAVAAMQVGLGSAEFGDFIAFSIYFQGLTSSLQQLMSAYVSLQESKAGIDRVAEAFTDDIGYADQHPVLSNDNLVEVSNLSFAYGPQKSVLRSCDFTVPMSGITALVGSSGSGKSTLMQLMLGELKPGSGTIRMNSLFRDSDRIGIVEQGTTTVPGTWRDNVSFGRENIDDQRIVEVLEAVGLSKGAGAGDQLLLKDIGEASGGELQRLMLARALVGDPVALLLDEPTSSVDGRMEHFMIKTVKNLSLSIPVLIVAHRPYTVQASDQILFLKDGRIKLQGQTKACIEQSSDLRKLLGIWNLNDEQQ